MKKTLFLLFATMALCVSSMKAQSSSDKWVFPKYKEFLGFYHSGPYGGPMYYETEILKVKTNSYLELDITMAPFWEGCTNFLWVINLPGDPSHMEFRGRDCRVKINGAGYGLLTINLIDRSGNHRAASFMLEVVN